MLRKILFLLAFLCVWKLDAQTLYPEVMSTFGGDAQTTAVQLTWTAGEPFYTTVASNETILTQGFNQTLVVIEVVTIAPQFEEYQLAVYPNPTPNILNISMKAGLKNALILQIFDLQGRLLHTQKAQQNMERVDFSKFTNGVYLLKISDNQQVIKTFKIQKVN